MTLSKEAELFEQTNIVDIGVQHNGGEQGEDDNQKLRNLEHSFDTFGLNGHDVDSPDVAEDEDDVIRSLSIDEVDVKPGLTSDTLNGATLENGTPGDSNLIVDEAFQQSLNERASQFSAGEGNSINTNSFPGVPKPTLDYEYTDKFELRSTIDEWFSSKEMKELPIYRGAFESRFDSYGFNRLGVDDKESVVEQLLYELNTVNYDSAVTCLLFISLGAYDEDQFIFEDHITNIRRNSFFLVRSGIMGSVLKLLDKGFHLTATSENQLALHSSTLFQILTLLYIVTLMHSTEDTGDSDAIFLRDIYDEHQTLNKLIKFIDTWRWNSRASMRIRNVLLLFTLLIQFQFGDLEKRRKVKAHLCKRLGLQKSTESSVPSASPVDFHAFRQDIIARYPAYVPPPSTLPSDFDDPTTLLQFINAPRPQSAANRPNALSQPPPTVHISTPVSSPSPPMSAMNKQLKGKRSFQTNVNYPLFYPSQGTDSVPLSIKEASEIFSSHVQEKLSLKQIWHERDVFVKQERGWNDSTDVPDSFDEFVENGIDTEEGKTLKRVKLFYHDSMCYFSSLVHVCSQLMTSAQGSLDILINKLPSSSDMEMIRAKEVMLKNSVYCLLLLLRWLKTSHVLKYEYLGTLIYDANFFTFAIHYLKVLDVKILERAELTALYNFRNSLWVDVVPPKVDKNFCFTLISMMDIMALLCKGKTQRILTISESDASGVFRNLLSISNQCLWVPVLKIVKEITPFNGKKWKTNNMDLISMVYCHGKVKLKDNWLSGKDVEAEISDAYGQEIALRALIQFHNIRKYADGMRKLGYEKNRTWDFFSRAAESIATDV